MPIYCLEISSPCSSVFYIPIKQDFYLCGKFSDPCTFFFFSFRFSYPRMTFKEDIPTTSDHLRYFLFHECFLPKSFASIWKFSFFFTSITLSLCIFWENYFLLKFNSRRKGKWLSEKALQIAEKRREMKAKEKRKDISIWMQSTKQGQEERWKPS